MHRIGSSLQHLATGPFDDHLRTRINADLEAILRTRLAALAEGGSEAATQGARADAGTATDAMKSGVAALRLLVEERHAWGGAYGELLEIRAWVGGGTPFHGV